jgi:LacI family transcriptional regulator
MSRPTQKDVARLAGVSRATVSYVINKRSGGKVQITEETRHRVLEAIDELGYRPNVAARSLRTQQTQLLAVMVSDLTNAFYPLLIRGAQAVAHEHDYQILVYDCNDNPTHEHTFIDRMLRWRVDGIIMVPFHLEVEDVARLTQAGIHVVTVTGKGSHVGGDDNVQPEEGKAILELMRYLASRGHRRIAHLAGRQDTPPGRIRLQGYRKALAKIGIPYDESLVCFGDFHCEGIEELIHSLFPSTKHKEHPTAIFAANDIMAVEAIRALTRHGWRVPQDVAVCGFDNIPEAEMIAPTLTTIDQFPQAMGQRAAELLMDRLHSSEPIEAREVTTPCRLVIRESA